MGVANPAGNFIVVSEGHLDADGIPVVVLAKRTAFTAEELSRVQEHMAVHPRLFLLYAPSDPASDRDQQAGGTLFRQRRFLYPADPVERSEIFCCALPVRCVSGDRQRSVFLFHLEARTAPASEIAAARDRLESQSGRGRAGDGSGHLVPGRPVVSGSSSGEGRPEASNRVRFACSTSSPSGWDTFWWRSLSSSASCCSWVIRFTR